MLVIFPEGSSILGKQLRRLENMVQYIYRKEHMSIFHKRAKEIDIYFVKNNRHDELDIYFDLKEAIHKADTQADID